MEAKLNSTELDPEKDIKFVNDDLYYTFSGAMKMTKLGDSALRKEVKEKHIRVFKHPACDLFSKEAINEWVIEKTIEPERKEKKKR